MNYFLPIIYTNYIMFEFYYNLTFKKTYCIYQ